MLNFYHANLPKSHLFFLLGNMKFDVESYSNIGAPFRSGWQNTVCAVASAAVAPCNGSLRRQRHVNAIWIRVDAAWRNGETVVQQVEVRQIYRMVRIHITQAFLHETRTHIRRRVNRFIHFVGNRENRTHNTRSVVNISCELVNEERIRFSAFSFCVLFRSRGFGLFFRLSKWKKRISHPLGKIATTRLLLWWSSER